MGVLYIVSFLKKNKTFAIRESQDQNITSIIYRVNIEMFE